MGNRYCIKQPYSDSTADHYMGYIRHCHVMVYPARPITDHFIYVKIHFTI